MMKTRKLFIYFALFTLIFGSSENLFAQKKRKTSPHEVVTVRAGAPVTVNAESPLPKSLSPEMERRVKAFRFAWETLNKNYFDPTFNGLNWQEIKKEFEPRVLQTKDDREFHALLQDMINRLDRSHLAVVPPEVYQTIQKAKAEVRAKEERNAARKKDIFADKTGKNIDEETFEDEGFYTYGIGIDLRLMNDKFVITRIEKDSAAEYSGLKTGYIVEKINNVSLEEMIWRIGIYYKNPLKVKKRLPSEVIGWFLNGEEDTHVTLTVRDEKDETKDFRIKREKLRGEMISLGKAYPEQLFSFESASLDENVGYIRFNLFAFPVIEKFCNAVSQLKDKKAIIIDLRGNKGGILGLLVGLGGMLTENSIDLGTSIYKVGRENFTAETKAKNFKGKLIFLVDGQTYSAAEVFAAAFREGNRAVVIGEKTAGEALPSLSVQLETGATLLYPIANYKTSKGNFLEGRGVEPDITVSLDRKSLLEGKDLQLEAAFQVINEKKSVTAKSKETLKDEEPLPPPPPAAISAKPKVLAVPEKFKIGAPPPPAVLRTAPNDVKDEKALKIIEDFLTVAGGREALTQITSYTAKAAASVAVKGSMNDFGMQISRQKPDKYSEILISPTVGDIREIRNGNKYFVQTDYGMMQNMPSIFDSSEVEIFAPINFLARKDYFKSLTFKGVFEIGGRQANIIEARTVAGAVKAFAFDTETKFLVSYASSFYTTDLSDYRKVGNVFLPFSVDRKQVMSVKIYEIKLNPTIDESAFTKKENCYDKPE